MLQIRIEHFGRIIIIHLSGSLNIGNLSIIEKSWREQVGKNPEVIALNCAELENVDSSAIGTIVKFFNHAMDKTIKLVFYDLNPIIEKLFATARLTRFFSITTRHEFNKVHHIPLHNQSSGELRMIV